MARPNQSFQRDLNALGFQFSRDNKTLQVAGTLGAALRLMKGIPECKLNPYNPQDRDDYGEPSIGNFLLKDRDTTWCGGSCSDLYDWLAGKIDMQPFKRAYQDFLNSGLRKDLETDLADVLPKRKRRFSEHDGEWSYDRRYEIEPFQATTIRYTPTRILEIRANFTVSASGNAREIDRYGAMVWGVSQLIEQAGIQTRIVWTNHCRDADRDRELNVESSILVKQPGQYLAPSLLAACFKANFYRRLGFSFIVAACEAQGFKASRGLGSPVYYPPAVFEKGVLRLAPECATGYTDELKRAITAAIRGK